MPCEKHMPFKNTRTLTKKLPKSHVFNDNNRNNPLNIHHFDQYWLYSLSGQ